MPSKSGQVAVYCSSVIVSGVARAVKQEPDHHFEVRQFSSQVRSRKVPDAAAKGSLDPVA